MTGHCGCFGFHHDCHNDGGGSWKDPPLKRTPKPAKPVNTGERMLLGYCEPGTTVEMIRTGRTLHVLGRMQRKGRHLRAANSIAVLEQHVGSGGRSRWKFTTFNGNCQVVVVGNSRLAETRQHPAGAGSPQR